jgi:hypothetical protein
MLSGALFPPNCYALSDVVVGSVVQRTQSYRSSMPEPYAAVVDTNPRPRGGSKLARDTAAASAPAPAPARTRVTKRSRPMQSELDASLAKTRITENVGGGTKSDTAVDSGR